MDVDDVMHSLAGVSPNLNSSQIFWLYGTYHFLEDLGLCVVVHGSAGIRQVFSTILDVLPTIHHTGATGQHQFLGIGNNEHALSEMCSRAQL